MGKSLFLAALLAGCAGESTVAVSIYGEAFIEEEIPADEVADGWAIQFTTFLVAVDGIAVEGEPLSGAFVFDLSQPSGGAGHDVGGVAGPDGPLLVDYRIGPVASAEAGNTTSADVDFMTSNGYSVWAEGTATRGGETIAFAWPFTTDTTYVACEAEGTAQLTIHADHLFYDDLDLPEPNVVFDLIASADANDDGEVTPEELAAVDIRAEAAYGVGSRDITDLWAFIAAQTRTLGHINGEGHCDVM